MTAPKFEWPPKSWPPTTQKERIATGKAFAFLIVGIFGIIGIAIGTVAGLVYAVRWAWVAGGS